MCPCCWNFPFHRFWTEHKIASCKPFTMLFNGLNCVKFSTIVKTNLHKFSKIKIENFNESPRMRDSGPRHTVDAGAVCQTTFNFICFHSFVEFQNIFLSAERFSDYRWIHSLMQRFSWCEWKNRENEKHIHHSSTNQQWHCLRSFIVTFNYWYYAFNVEWCISFSWSWSRALGSPSLFVRIHCYVRI